MTSQSLRKHSKKIGLAAVLVGGSVLVAGLFLGNATLIATGSAALFLGGYAIAFAHVGSF